MLDPIRYAEREARIERRDPISPNNGLGKSDGELRMHSDICSRVRIVNGNEVLEVVLDEDTEPEFLS